MYIQVNFSYKMEDEKYKVFARVGCTLELHTLQQNAIDCWFRSIQSPNKETVI